MVSPSLVYPAPLRNGTERGSDGHPALSSPYIQSTVLYQLTGGKLYPSQTQGNQRKHLVEYSVYFIAACIGSLSCHFYVQMLKFVISYISCKDIAITFSVFSVSFLCA